MNRLAVALAPLILAASAFSAQAQDPHAGHVMPATPAPTRPAPAPIPAPQTPARPATQDPHAGHVMPPAQTPPAADPHASHQMPAQPTAVDPHAGHDMSTTTPAQPDPHAGHDMARVRVLRRWPDWRLGVGGRFGRGPCRRRHAVACVRILRLGAQSAGREDQRREGDGGTVHDAAPSMGRTVTTLNIPACMCISMWQWKAQSPGASAVRSKVTLPPGATLTVCFRG